MQFYFNAFKTKKYTKIKKKCFFLGKCKIYRIKKCVILIGELIKTKIINALMMKLKIICIYFFMGIQDKLLVDKMKF